MTPHFTLDEFTLSQTATRRGIDNTPPDEILPAILRTMQGLERIRAIVGKPIIVTSGYRSPRLNAAVGGVPHSQHVLGQAADIKAAGMPVVELAKAIDMHRHEILFDQCILEFGRWVHVSFTDQHPRMVALTRTQSEYLRGIQA